MSLSGKKRHIIQMFDTVAPGYERAALRFFAFAADQMVDLLKPRRTDKVLDVATGTGLVATALAQAVTEGRVFGVDLSGGMLARAEEKIAAMGFRNVDLFDMDAEQLEFRGGYFNHVTCGYGIFFLDDVLKGVREWARVLRPAGRVLFSTFGPDAFQPMADLFCDRMAGYGVEVPGGGRQESIKRLSNPDECRRLMEAAGLEDVQVVTRQLGYYLADTGEWWEVVWNAGFRGMVDRLNDEQRKRFRREHLEEVAKLADEHGIRLNAETHFVSGRKPA